MAAGLDYALQKGITHRDLKLSNVLLSSIGRACLVDFGLAVIDKTMADAPGFNPRSVDYAGLEKTTNVPRDDKRSDMFFLGCLVYHMLSGHPPLFETRERIRRMSSERFRDIPPITQYMQLPHRVVILLRRLMELDPEKRIQSPSLALRDLDDLIAAVKSGDVQQYSEELSEQDSALFEQRTKKYYEGRDYTLMLIEPKIDAQNQLRARLKKLGYRVLILGDLRRALDRFEDLDQAESNPADCVLFSAASMGTDALEAFNFFATHPRMRTIPAILMVGEDQKAIQEAANLNDHRVSISVPAKFRIIRLTLRQLLNIETSEAMDDDV